MSSRFWLALAFVVAFGPQPAHAETPSEEVKITLDQAKVAKLREGTSALVVGKFGPEPARAEASSEVLAVTLDEAKVAKLPEGTSTLVVGNPMIADVTMLKTGDAMVLTGKGYGETNLIALDLRGAVIFERRLRVLPNKSVLVLQNGASRVSYSCNPECMPTVQLGDDPKTFNDAGGEITSRNGLASGGVK